MPADLSLGLAIRKQGGEPLARHRNYPTHLDGQAFRVPQPHLSAAERRAIERSAMDLVQADYMRRRYNVEDVSREGSWDLTATHPNGDIVHIEVEGTTGTGQAVTVTAGERRHAEEFARPALAIVTGIRLNRGRTPTATDGALTVHLNPWSTKEGGWATTVWRYEPPQ